MMERFQHLHINKPKKGGYGTKIMDTIADKILNGTWEISTLPNGEVRVTPLS
ncbi:hypothetical protein H6G06_00930 [Anabaena sphaerica FACHB-251]|uniref:Uncharacterized protein n=1 Tax=Anabaena sphaerica FACHB-251 TaxID=2692883 RepID=A0A926WEN7_9NOST|nr:hypothetical protein [Anabaena sphaerica]MBD2292076.1 hypothetical protein [Anabaena sphaerica FACHB-251]